MQFREDLRKKDASIDGTLFIDEHSEYCVLGWLGHHGQSGKWEWRAPKKDGRWCHPNNGGELEPKQPQPKAKNPARADGIFGVCVPTPIGGRRREGCRMAPLCYKGKVVGISAFNDALIKEI